MRYFIGPGSIKILLGILLGVALSINSGCTWFIAKTAYKAGKAIISREQSDGSGSPHTSNEKSDGSVGQSL